MNQYPPAGGPGQPAGGPGYPASSHAGSPGYPAGYPHVPPGAPGGPGGPGGPGMPQQYGSDLSRPSGVAGARSHSYERNAPHVGGAPAFLLLLILIALEGLCLWLILSNMEGDSTMIVSGVAGMVLFLVFFPNFMIIAPGTTRVIQFFGNYLGTIRRTGLVFTYPLVKARPVSVRVKNFETSELKVNDADGNPINIATIVVWQVADTAKAMFDVEDYTGFVTVQAESALRHIAGTYSYDNPDTEGATLRGSTDVVSAQLAQEMAERAALAGIQIIETRISKLAYAPEIAQAMLQRQQAGAIIAAREKIVEGAVTMVEGALARLEAEKVVELDEERKAAMVSNLLVVLCGESRATPIVNAGSLYH